MRKHHYTDACPVQFLAPVSNSRLRYSNPLWGNNLKRILSFSCSPFLFLYTYHILKQKQKKCHPPQKWGSSAVPDERRKNNFCVNYSKISKTQVLAPLTADYKLFGFFVTFAVSNIKTEVFLKQQLKEHNKNKTIAYRRK